MKTFYLLLVALAFTFTGCNNNKEDKMQKNMSDPSVQGAEESETIAIDILLDPDQTMLDASKKYNDRMRENYPDGFELDASHRPHITVIQAFVKKSDLKSIEQELRRITENMNLTERDMVANGLYYIPYEAKGLAGITVEKDQLIDFHNQVVEMMKPYIVANGTGAAFVPRPDGEAIMQGTTDYVNSFVQGASGEKYNPHVTIGTAHEDFVKGLLSEPFEKFTFHVESVSIYQLGELGTAQVKLATIDL